MCFHISHCCDQIIPRWVTKIYTRFEVNKDIPFLDVTSCMPFEIYRQCEEIGLHFQGRRLIRVHGVTFRNTVLWQIHLLLNLNWLCLVVITVSLYLRRRRNGVETYVTICFSYTPLCLQFNECYLLIFPHKFKFRFPSEAMEFKCSLLLNSDGSLYS